MYEAYNLKLARDCLMYLVKRFHIRQMHIPYYLCDAIRHSLVEAGCKPLFYHIDDEFSPDCDFNKNDYILYPNYFGICGENTKKLADIYPKLIVDNAHAYYDEPMGFACFNAGHKFGFEKSQLIIKKSTLTLDKSMCEDARTRKKRFSEIHKRFSVLNNLNINIASVVAPFVYPCLLKTEDEADKLAAILKSEGKVIYRYWNPLPKNFNEYKFYSRLVPIPID